ncbi:VOC family protein [Streptomyces daliensis]
MTTEATATEATTTGAAREDNLVASGIVLGSTEPDRLVAWYRAALEPLGARWEEHMLVVAEGLYVGFDRRDDVAAKTVEPGRQLVNFGVRDIRAAEAHLNSLHVRWIRPVEAVGWGFMSTVEDPDGNYLQFIQADTRPDGSDGSDGSESSDRSEQRSERG